LLAAAGKEERHVRVLFGFGDAQLVQAERGEVFAERVGSDCGGYATR
jgi:hypothetical protein